MDIEETQNQVPEFKVGDHVEYYDEDEKTGVKHWVPAHIYDIEKKPISERYLGFVLFKLPCFH